MDTTQILPNIGAPVSSPAFDESAIPGMSLGEAAYAMTLFAKAFLERIAAPAAVHEFAAFLTASGSDWSGLHSVPAVNNGQEDAERAIPPETEDRSAAEESAARAGHQVPQAPEKYYDSMPGIAHMLRVHQHATDAMLTHFAAHVDATLGDQETYLGIPKGIKGFNDSPQYFREVLKFSRATTKKIHDRIPYVTWTPGKDPTWQAYQPQLAKVATSFAEGHIPAENLDRLIGLDQDLTKYVRKTKALPEDKADVMAAFEPALVDAAETATPDELSKAKARWADRIAHALDPDGPPVAYAIRKQADNAIRTQNMADGSGKISMHATPELYALFKNWSLHQLNFHGTPIAIPQEHLDLLKTDPTDPAADPNPADTFSDINDLKAQPNPDATAEDAKGNSVPADEVDAIEQLTTGQRLAAIVMGMFHTIVTMNPTDLSAKQAHGASAQLMIIQDIQTAYETLGVGALPEAVRRPPGPTGLVPPRITAPNPDDPDTPRCQDPAHTTSYQPPPWTPFVSEAVNIGPIHPHDATPLACDSTLVGQIWNGTHEVLAQHRAHRFFTPTQRRAILARDRGCQTPGCTVPAVYCQIHHITDWQHDGPTDVDNAITLCAHHHGAVHNGKWTIRKHHGATFFQPAPWLDPTQPLLRNLYWSL